MSLPKHAQIVILRIDEEWYRPMARSAVCNVVVSIKDNDIASGTWRESRCVLVCRRYEDSHSGALDGTTGSYLVLVAVQYNPDETPYEALAPGSSKRSFLPGPGEALPLQSIVLHFEGVIRVEGGLLSVSPRKHYILFSTKSPPSIQRIPWPASHDAELYEHGGTRQYGYDSWVLNEADFPWLEDPDVMVCSIFWFRGSDVESWITSDGRAYFVQLSESAYSDTNTSNPDVVGDDAGQYSTTSDRKGKSRAHTSLESITSQPSSQWHGTCIHDVEVPRWIQKRRQVDPQDSEANAHEYNQPRRAVIVAVNSRFSLIAVGTQCGTVEYTTFPTQEGAPPKPQFWVPGNFELVVLAQSSPNKPEGQVFTIPFAKSATTGLHAPIPQSYLAANWPVRYSSISSDGRLIAIAGRRGLTHYSSTSGRWKLFPDEMQEQAFTVKGGLLWFHHVLIATVEVSKSWQIRLYSRDLELSNQNVLYREMLSSPVVILSLVDNSLLVYTADSALSHYLILPTTDSIELHFCGSITFDGIIANPNAVRVLSWLIPTAQKQLGDPADDLSVATVLMMVGGQLVLLRPRKSGDQEVSYDMQILADRIEFCWIHLRGIGSLENSLWGFDGQSMRVWLNALSIEAPQLENSSNIRQEVKESVNIPIDFYPLSVLMDKGIIIGAEHEITTRMNLPFLMFRHATSSHLFLHHILLFHLAADQVREAVLFASHYQHLVFFAHALEILLHTVVESETTTNDEGQEAPGDVLRAVVEFLDHFDVALDVVVGCARKTEVTRWPRLFDVVGNPKSLFETCLKSRRLRTAGSYLLVLHSLEQLEAGNDDALRLLRSAVEAKDWQLCRELLRFFHSIDSTGDALREALAQPFMLDKPETWKMATVTRSMEPVNFTPEGAVTISFKTLVSAPLSLTTSIEKAFGSQPGSLGIVIVRDLPPAYPSLREKLMKLAYSFAHLGEPTREKYADMKSRYSFGWSHGKEIMNGKPDTLKGSYYANPVVDKPSVSAALQNAYPEYYGANVWPENENGVEDFEAVFKDLGRFVFDVGCKLAAACQPFASPYMTDSSLSLAKLIGSSQTTKARLLHYFPPSAENPLPRDSEPIDSWCGFHLDHSLLTGLCSAMYLKQDPGVIAPTVVSSPSPTSGLYIRSRGGDLTKVSIPPDCLAFQTGEALELATAGRLRATPHCVRVGAGQDAEKVSRETFALFMQPDVDQQISAGETFGQFSKRVFDEHYKEDDVQ
ncbi:hypothetical protein EW146_g469 [Bondarzewia mesenterica]|uniref:RIC1 C-terminal alpha solenoid region domain-containing protein n=1 Tax=Bondarzewia mesenterica TaxID=1095465 RepID=A0A4S4M6V8_9AGAM|nr:hypothetical protein EW146_g469 [Bondarzewia mesenterica]